MNDLIAQKNSFALYLLAIIISFLLKKSSKNKEAERSMPFGFHFSRFGAENGLSTSTVPSPYSFFFCFADFFAFFSSVLAVSSIIEMGALSPILLPTLTIRV